MTSIWAYMIPRSPMVIAGRLPSKNPESLMIATSARKALALLLEPRLEVHRARLLLAFEDVLSR
jgi:hypothetical protein